MDKKLSIKTSNVEARLSKILARRGYCSRREAEKHILNGEVEVDGKLSTSLSEKFSYNAAIKVKGVALAAAAKSRIWIYNKPKGVLVTNHDAFSRKTIFDLLPKNMPRVVTVGRLDLNSEGLLILTNDGDLARKMELPSNKYERVYRCRADGQLSEKDILGINAQGVITDDFHYKDIKILQERHSEKRNVWYSITLREGKNREIRRIFEHFNLSVSRLIRVKYGPFSLEGLDVNQIKEKSLRQI